MTTENFSWRPFWISIKWLTNWLSVLSVDGIGFWAFNFSFVITFMLLGKIGRQIWPIDYFHGSHFEFSLKRPLKWPPWILRVLFSLYTKLYACAYKWKANIASLTISRRPFWIFLIMASKMAAGLVCRRKWILRGWIYMCTKFHAFVQKCTIIP